MPKNPHPKPSSQSITGVNMPATQLQIAMVRQHYNFGFRLESLASAVACLEELHDMCKSVMVEMDRPE